MKKKIFGILIVAAVAIVAGWNVNQNSKKVQLSDLTLSNVEALAWSEADFIQGRYCQLASYESCSYSDSEAGYYIFPNMKRNSNPGNL
ncbi:NVEALA domain-containing protein [Parabacteroides bouchesdurhonensis]|uniref:NVEALA domain-containing protein n=1 Tax=Parabacteroides bouchesdurhonensis TaxID=1936995 RepID=UPI000E499D79|nr:NVEALA domain-containing protein [Parabacteroides bouchesdurhonensis]RHJ94028.1 hypothetical protein DW095_03290 [Bacteroides sp. AM07-16]